MKRVLPFLLAPLLTACGNNALLLEYIVNVQVDAHESLGSQNVALLDIGKCANAAVFDQTLLVYEGYFPDATMAVKMNWSGIDLSEGGDNHHIYMARDGENVEIRAALQPEVVLYEVTRKGKLIPVADDVEKTANDVYTASYNLGLGLPIVETHTISEQVNEIEFIEESSGNCDI